MALSPKGVDQKIGNQKNMPVFSPAGVAPGLVKKAAN
jgi:hypothetical protein